MSTTDRPERSDRQELVLVFFESRDGRDWHPIPRDDIPEWLRRHEYWDRLVAGEMVRNLTEDAERKGMHWYAASAVDRLRIPRGAILLPAHVLSADGRVLVQ